MFKFQSQCQPNDLETFLSRKCQTKNDDLKYNFHWIKIKYYKINNFVNNIKIIYSYCNK